MSLFGQRRRRIDDVADQVYLLELRRMLDETKRTPARSTADYIAMLEELADFAYNAAAVIEREGRRRAGDGELLR